MKLTSEAMVIEQASAAPYVICSSIYYYSSYISIFVVMLCYGCHNESINNPTFVVVSYSRRPRGRRAGGATGRTRRTKDSKATG
jgi:hypothetical protein